MNIININNIPETLKALPQWLCWKYKDKDLNNKPTKIPIDPYTGESTSAPDAAWGYADCMKAVSEHPEYGLGISLKDGLFGIDYDNVLNELGELKPEVTFIQDEINATGSYTEISPSKNGLHILAFCDNPEKYEKRRKRKDNTEIYFTGRFFTVTGNIWVHSPLESAGKASDDAIEHILKRIEVPKSKNANITGKDAPKEELLTSTCLNDDVIIDSICRNPKTAKLWDGDTSGYNSPSEADAALFCALAFWCNKDGVQMERIARRSGLVREKWDERPDYISRTITNACNFVQNEYNSNDSNIICDEAFLNEFIKSLSNVKSEIEKEVVSTAGVSPPEEGTEGYFPKSEDVKYAEFRVNGYPPLRGHLAEIARFCMEVANRPRPIMARVAAMMFGVCVCGRHFCAFNSIYSIIYLALFAPSGAGKEDLKSCIQKLADEVNCDELVAHVDGWTSDSAVHATIAERPQSIAAWDEMGAMLQRMTKSSRDTIASTALLTLTKQFTNADKTFHPKKFADASSNKNKKTGAEETPKTTSIVRPAMSVIGFGNPDDLSIISQEMISDGSMARWLYIEMGDEPVKRRYKESHLPQNTIEYIQKILLLYGNWDNAGKIMLAKATDETEPIKMDLCYDENKGEMEWEGIDENNQKVTNSLKREWEKALNSRLVEIASKLSISRTILGNPDSEAEVKKAIDGKKEGKTENISLPYTVLKECIDEIGSNQENLQRLWLHSQEYTQNERETAEAIAENFRNRQNKETLSEGERYCTPEVLKDLTDRQGMKKPAPREIGNIRCLLSSIYKIYYRKENDKPTGKGYYYDGASPDSQIAQEEFDRMKTERFRRQNAEHSQK